MDVGPGQGPGLVRAGLRVGRLLADALARAAARQGAVAVAGRARLVCRRGRAVGVMLGGVLAGSGHYLVAFDASRVVAGATREAGAGFEYRVTAAGLTEVLGQALVVAPGLATARYLETRVGFRPMSRDARPLLGPVPGVDGLVIATGLGPTGLTMGPYAGAVAARAALGEPPGVDLAPLGPLREIP